MADARGIEEEERGGSAARRQKGWSGPNAVTSGFQVVKQRAAGERLEASRRLGKQFPKHPVRSKILNHPETTQTFLSFRFPHQTMTYLYRRYL
jgi:hypothetical protein